MTSHKPLRVALLAAICSTAPAAAVAQTINLLTEEAYPFQYLDNKQLTGMAAEVVTEIFKRAGIAHKDEMLTWKDAYDRAQVYPNTCIYSTARTENRAKAVQVDRADRGEQVGGLCQGRASRARWRALTTSSSIALASLQGDAKERYLKDLAGHLPRSAEPDDATNPSKLTLNRTEPDKIDLWVTGYYTGAHIAAKTGVRDIYPVWVFETSENYLACQQSLPQATADKLQKALDAMKRDGTHAKIVARYEARIKAQ
jgi:polar amino acid transport system substrate-binding protein